MEPIRVLHVVTYMGIGGLETMLMNYYRHIDRTKVQFDFLVHRQERWDYDDEIESLGGKIYRFPRLNPLSLEYKRKLREFFGSHKEYRVVHSHVDCMSGIPLKAAHQAGVPIRIAHSHNNSQDKNVKYAMKMMCKRIIPRYATHLMACSQEAGKWMFGDHAFAVLHNAIEAKRYEYNLEIREKMRSELKIQEDEMVIGHVGRFVPQKNHDFLVDVFGEMQKIKKSKMILVGDCSLREKIEKKVENLGITDRVIFTGIRKDVGNLMQAMDTFVFPSLHEGLPLTMIEAQAAGLPCVVSDGVPIECDLTGLVKQVPLSASVKTWVEAVINTQNAARQNTYEAIRAHGYDIAENVAKLQGFYLELAKKGEHICL